MKKLLPLLIVLVSCGGDDGTSIPLEVSEIWKPTSGTTFDWILDGDIPASVNAEMIDIDGFDAETEEVTKLRNNEIAVIGYISVGTIENWRPDIGNYPSEIVGNDYDGWEGEKWVDISSDLLKPIIEARLDMLVSKGFNGIEPDNLDGYENSTGFTITEQQAIDFCKWLAGEAHERNLSIGQKNVPEFTSELVTSFDWILTEDMFAQEWEEDVKAYVTAGKAVFATEYTDELTDFTSACQKASMLNYDLILKDRDLTAATERCN
jgi:endo-alpha-1,4-polygalactosaminidase (GH114 family)